MRRQLVSWIAACGGVVARADALSLFPPHVLDDAIQAGVLVRVLPSVYALPPIAAERRTLRRAALLYRPDAALSHLDGLDGWNLPGGEHATGPITMVAPAEHRESRCAEVRVARRQGFTNAAPHVVTRDGMRLVRLERTIIDSWPCLPDIDKRAPTLVAVRDRRTTGPRLLSTLEHSGRVQGCAQMRRLFGLVAAGCHSHLELWGHEHVFNRPGLGHARCQMPLMLPSGKVYLDRFYEEELLAVELDGAAYHGAPGQRERDIRRDVAVAAFGIQTIRFGHPRLFGDPAGVAEETLAILAVRRAQLGVRPA